MVLGYHLHYRTIFAESNILHPFLGNIWCHFKKESHEDNFEGMSAFEPTIFSFIQPVFKKLTQIHCNQ